MLTSSALQRSSESPDEANRSAKDVYDTLAQPGGESEATRSWLEGQVAAAHELPNSLPEDPESLMTWMDENVERVGDEYVAYLKRRKEGGPREYFANRSHALHFLSAVAPTKLVDGAWLYSSLTRWDDARMLPLINTYLEELGEGDAGQNHVVMFKELLHKVGAPDNLELRDELYVQGAIQLALGAHGREFVPEMIGFNLGYEQLPLHLHICAYEFNELGIDPYYFTVHITVDNAGSGHARQAVQAVMNALPEEGQARRNFYNRVRAGFALNDLGVGATAIAHSFDIDAAVIDMLAAKSKYGRAAHADYCKVAGRTVNDWLSDAAQIPAFVAALQDAKWIVRHQDPQSSRFWKLLQGGQAEMFGVFSPYELQLLYDWIAGDCPDYLPGPDLPSVAPRKMINGRHLSYRAQLRSMASGDQRQGGTPGPSGSQPIVFSIDEDYDSNPTALLTRLAKVTDRTQRMTVLLDYLSPQKHHTPEGLYATRLYRRSLLEGARGVA